MSTARRCLRVLDDETQCHFLDWCPLHGDIDDYTEPATPRGILTSADLADASCAICEPDANDKQGADHRTDQHDDRGTWLG